MTTPLRLVVISTSRSEFGQLAPIVRLAQGDPRFAVTFAVGGMHLDSGTPLPSECIGLDVVRLPRPADSLGLVHQVAVRDLLARQQAECVLLLGDRFELLELAVPCVLSGAVIAHLSGGERTAGAIDDQVRDAVSKLAHLHFPAHAAAGARLEALAEEPWRICVAGEPGLDAIRLEGLLTPAELGQDLGLEPAAGDVLVAVHPVTRDQDQTAAILAAIATVVDAEAGVSEPEAGGHGPCLLAERPGERTGRRWFFSSPNGDPGSDGISATWRALAERHPGRCIALVNRGARWFRSITAVCGLQIGNSSAGLVEAPSLHAVTIDVGTRQRGRPRGGSVVTIETVTAEILRQALTQAAAPTVRAAACPGQNPYGDSHTAERVLDFLAAHARQERVRTKA